VKIEPFIEMCSGRLFYFLADDPGFVAEELAAGVSKQCRYTGQTKDNLFYSVGEHEVLVSEIMEKLDIGDPREGLQHDDIEAVLNDVNGPAKAMLPDYKALEYDLEVKHRRHFGLPLEKTPECKHADLIALMVEGRSLLVSRGESMIKGGIPAIYGDLADMWIAKYGKSIYCLTPAGAYTSYMHRYNKLMRRRN
jgi:uncharacterized protein